MVAKSGPSHGVNFWSPCRYQYFSELPYRYRYFSELPYQYLQKWPYRYRCPYIDNRYSATWHRLPQNATDWLKCFCIYGLKCSKALSGWVGWDGIGSLNSTESTYGANKVWGKLRIKLPSHDYWTRNQSCEAGRLGQEASSSVLECPQEKCNVSKRCTYIPKSLDFYCSMYDYMNSSIAWQNGPLFWLTKHVLSVVDHLVQLKLKLSSFCLKGISQTIETEMCVLASNHPRTYLPT